MNVPDSVMMTEPPISYRRHRFPPQIIAPAVWLYFRFPLSLRLAEELLLERGIEKSYLWRRRSRGIRSRRNRPGSPQYPGGQAIVLERFFASKVVLQIE